MGRQGRRWHRGLDRGSRERGRVLVDLVMLHSVPELWDFPRAAKEMPHLQGKDSRYAASVSGLEPGI